MYCTLKSASQCQNAHLCLIAPWGTRGSQTTLHNVRMPTLSRWRSCRWFWGWVRWCGRAAGRGRSSLAPGSSSSGRPDDLKKRMNRIKASWQNGCCEKRDYHQVPTISNHHPTKMDVLPNTFVQIILAAKWLAWHSSLSPKQQRWPLPSLLSLSFFYAWKPVCEAASCSDEQILYIPLGFLKDT